MTDAATLEVLPKSAPVKGGVVPTLLVDGAIKAGQFYVKAFGAELAAQYPPDEKGRTMHVHLYVNGGSVMLGDAYPEHGVPLVRPQAFNVTLCMDEGGQAWFDRAVAAGCEVKMPFQPMFWGDHYGQLQDPFGVAWSINSARP